MTTTVSDKFSNFNDNLAHAAKIIGRSRHRRAIFEAIYRGKQVVKTQDEIRRATGLSLIRILQETQVLFANDLIGRVKEDGHFAYKKDTFYSNHKNKVLGLAGNKEKLKRLPTKVNVRSTGGSVIIKAPRKTFTVQNVTIDDVDSFSKVRRIAGGQQMKPVSEEKFKQGVKRVIGEAGKFTDWGGEKNDLFTTRIRLKGRRIPCAFAFKGKGKRGILKPKDFGRNGDQIQRLFQSDAQLFMLQYWYQLDQAVFEQMRWFATARSAMTGEKIYFGIIDGDDTQRLKLAYPACFRN